MISREDYERGQRAMGLVPDITYGPSGNTHPYDFSPDPEAQTAEEAGRYGEAVALAAEGHWERPGYPPNVTVVDWGWGTVRHWFTKEQYAYLNGEDYSE